MGPATVSDETILVITPERPVIVVVVVVATAPTTTTTADLKSTRSVWANVVT